MQQRNEKWINYTEGKLQECVIHVLWFIHLNVSPSLSFSFSLSHTHIKQTNKKITSPAKLLSCAVCAQCCTPFNYGSRNLHAKRDILIVLSIRWVIIQDALVFMLRATPWQTRGEIATNASFNSILSSNQLACMVGRMDIQYTRTVCVCVGMSVGCGSLQV